MAKTFAQCAVSPNCMNPVLCREMCSMHYGEFIRHCAANGSMTRPERDAELKRLRESTPPPKWEYEPTPEQTAELIAMQEKAQEKLHV